MALAVFTMARARTRVAFFICIKYIWVWERECYSSEIYVYIPPCTYIPIYTVPVYVHYIDGLRAFTHGKVVTSVGQRYNVDVVSRKAI